MTKEEFIQECSMRNLSQCFSRMYTRDCNANGTINNCYNAAVKLSNLLFKEEENVGGAKCAMCGTEFYFKNKDIIDGTYVKCPHCDSKIVILD